MEKLSKGQHENSNQSNNSVVLCDDENKWIVDSTTEYLSDTKVDVESIKFEWENDATLSSAYSGFDNLFNINTRSKPNISNTLNLNSYYLIELEPPAVPVSKHVPEINNEKLST